MTTNTNTIETVFRSATRAGTSRMGNPSWVLHTDAGDYRTEANGGIGYSVGNYTHSRLGLVDKPVTLTLTRAGRVINMTPRA